MVKELTDFLEDIGKQGNHWMDKIRKYEKQYGIKLKIVLE